MPTPKRLKNEQWLRLESRDNGTYIRAGDHVYVHSRGERDIYCADFRINGRHIRKHQFVRRDAAIDHILNGPDGEKDLA